MIERLSRMFVKEEAGKISTPLSMDQHFDNVLPVHQHVRVAEITVEQNENKLPMVSRVAKLSQGKVNYHKWQRAATRLMDKNITEQHKKHILK